MFLPKYLIRSSRLRGYYCHFPIIAQASLHNGHIRLPNKSSYRILLSMFQPAESSTSSHLFQEYKSLQAGPCQSLPFLAGLFSLTKRQAFQVISSTL